MYNKKYRLEIIEEFKRHNSMYDDVKGRICYPAYFNNGECGWFLYDAGDLSGWCRRVRTSPIKDVEYTDDSVVITTQNTKLTFKMITENYDGLF